ncbi:MAG: hypothetical protein QXX95_04975 [Nitrososphaerales archaeon]
MAEKAQIIAQRKQEKQKKEAPKSKKEKRPFYLSALNEKDVEKALKDLKAITTYSLAKALDVNASLANSLIKSLESKNIIKKIGGYSGHYIYKSVSS